jgi:hypothetical protein
MGGLASVEGRPLVGARVEAYDLDSEAVLLPEGAAPILTDAAGRYTLRLPALAPGAVVVVVAADAERTLATVIDAEGALLQASAHRAYTLAQGARPKLDADLGEATSAVTAAFKGALRLMRRRLSSREPVEQQRELRRQARESVLALLAAERVALEEEFRGHPERARDLLLALDAVLRAPVRRGSRARRGDASQAFAALQRYQALKASQRLALKVLSDLAGAATDGPALTQADFPLGGVQPRPDGSLALEGPAGTETLTFGAQPAAPAPAPAGATVVVRGQVYDEDGGLVSGVRVTMRSLAQGQPYQAEAVTQGGAFVFNGVPAGVAMEAVATRAGWTTRRRVGTFQPQAGEANNLDFGRARATLGVTEGAAHFLSDRPEIVSVTPVDDATGVAPGDELTVALTLSEPLDEENRVRLEEAFRLLPANDVAAGHIEGAVDPEIGEDRSLSDGLGPLFSCYEVPDGTYGLLVCYGLAASDNRYRSVLSANRYEARRNDALLRARKRRVTMTWNAEGTVLTARLPVPLITGRRDGGRYVVALVTTDMRSIQDEAGRQLGTSANGLDSYAESDAFTYRLASAAPGAFILNAFKEADLTLVTRETFDYRLSTLPLGDVAFRNWADTHSSVADFTLARDEAPPVLRAVSAERRDEGHLRIALTFSEPMVAFHGSGGAYAGRATFELSRYSFAFGTRRGSTQGVRLDGTGQVLTVDGPSLVVPPEQEVRLGRSDAGAAWYPNVGLYTDATTPLAPGAGVEPSGLTLGHLGLESNPDDPRVLWLWVGGKGADFSGFREIKARAAGVEDPAGNGTSSAKVEGSGVTGEVSGTSPVPPPPPS